MEHIGEKTEGVEIPEQPNAWKEELSDAQKDLLKLFVESGVDLFPVLERLEHLAPGATRLLFDYAFPDAESIKKAREDTRDPEFRKRASEKLLGLAGAVDDKQLAMAVSQYNADIARSIAAEYVMYKSSLNANVELLLRPKVVRLLNEIHAPGLQNDAVKWFMVESQSKEFDVEGLSDYLMGEGEEMRKFADMYDLPEIFRSCAYVFSFSGLRSRFADIGIAEREDRAKSLGQIQDALGQFRVLEQQRGGREVIHEYSRAYRQAIEEFGGVGGYGPCVDSRGFAELIEEARVAYGDSEKIVAVLRQLSPFRWDAVNPLIAALNQVGNVEKKDILDFIQTPGDVQEKIKRAGFFSAFRSQQVGVPAPTLEDEWLNDVRARAAEAVMKKYGVKGAEVTDPDIALEFLAIKGDEEEIQRIADVFEHQERYTAQKAEHFELGKEYGAINVSGLKMRQDPADATEALVYGLLSSSVREIKNPESGRKTVRFQTAPLRKALAQFERDKLKNARIALQGFAPRKIYARLKNEIETLKDRGRSLKERGDAAKTIRAYLKEEICPRMGDRKRESLSDLVDSIESIGKEGAFDGVRLRTQRGEPGDLLDNRSTMCCAFYPDGANKNAAIGYFRDPYVVTLQAKSFTRSVEGSVERAAPIGVAICLLCKDTKGETTLLVDSVEGGTDLQRVPERQWMPAYFDALKSLARGAGVKRLVFTVRASNSTPQKFISFLKSKGFPEEEVALEKLGDTNEKIYLEFFAQMDELGGDAGLWRSPTGKGAGIIVELSR